MSKKENMQMLEAVETKENTEMEIDLLELCLRLLDNWKKIAIGTFVGILVMAVYSFMIAAPMYEATSKLYVLSSSDSALNLSDLQIGSYLTSDYVEVFDTWEVNEMVRRNLGLDYTYGQLSSMVSVSNPGDTRILEITAKSGDPKEAAALANEYAEVARGYISDVMMTDEPSILSVALEPVDPVSPQKLRNLVLGAILGFMAVCAYVVVIFILDDKIKTDEDIRKYSGLPTLAIIPDNVKAEQVDRKKISSKKN